MEDCQICWNAYDDAIKNWRVLNCSHKLCSECYKQIEATRSTMSGTSHTFVKCPFCQGLTGTEVGTCPDGEMIVKINSLSCEGYEEYDTIEIQYKINHRKYYLFRIAYLPNNSEGRKLLEMLKVAWDRRLCFTIGTSVTTGAEDVVVWNLHHKTSPSGGVLSYGYPDPTYFDRLRCELMACGIE